MRIVGMGVFFVALMATQAAYSSYQSLYYGNPGLITVERNGTIVDHLPCQRIALNNSWLYGMAQTNSARSSDGNIWSCVGWDVGDQLGSEALFRSEDGGVTWTYTMLPYTDTLDIQAFTVLNDDTMVMALNVNFNPGPRDRVRIYRSNNLGSSWTQTTTLYPTPFQYIGEGFMSMTQISTGQLLFPAVRWNDDPYNASGTNLRADLFVSTNGGTTFPTTYATFAWGQEAHVIQLQSGKLLGVFRYQRFRLPGETDAQILALGGNIDPTLDFAFKHVFLGDSDDLGVTWNNFRPVRGPNGQPLVHWGQAHGQLVQVPDGRVILVHDQRLPNRDNIARVSWDGGQTWETEIYYLSFGRGYASSVALQDGTIVTVLGNTPYATSGGRIGPWSAQVVRWQLPARNLLDADSDSIPTIRDNCPTTYNPNQQDTDSDGLGNACDNCPDTPSLDQTDLDSDGLGDVCDDDDDDDTVPDVNDNCPRIPNQDQADSDSDGVGSACDGCPNTPPGLRVDTSGCPLPIPGDFDRDLDVDQEDFGFLQTCLTGSGIPQTNPGCLPARLDTDSDVDQNDVGLFLNCWTGANIVGNQDCAK